MRTQAPAYLVNVLDNLLYQLVAVQVRAGAVLVLYCVREGRRVGAGGEVRGKQLLSSLADGFYACMAHFFYRQEPQQRPAPGSAFHQGVAVSFPSRRW